MWDFLHLLESHYHFENAEIWRIEICLRYLLAEGFYVELKMVY